MEEATLADQYVFVRQYDDFPVTDGGMKVPFNRTFSAFAGKPDECEVLD